MGTTASGKSDLAEAVADRLDAVLVNADAFQVYRGLDIGTAKPEDRSRYKLLDIKDPKDDFGVGEWVSLTLQELEIAWKEERNVVVVGGTGFYIRALFEEYDDMRGMPPPGLREELTREYEEKGLKALVEKLEDADPDAMKTTDLRNYQRVIRALEKIQSPPAKRFKLPPFQKHKYAILRDIQELAERIDARTRAMAHGGWVEECAGLLKAGYQVSDPGFRAHGYRAMSQVAEGTLDLEEAISLTSNEVRQYAKRQRTWLRKEPSVHTLQGMCVLQWSESIIHSIR
jgi:tRNA dimethylallyltransferase